MRQRFSFSRSMTQGAGERIGEGVAFCPVPVTCRPCPVRRTPPPRSRKPTARSASHSSSASVNTATESPRWSCTGHREMRWGLARFGLPEDKPPRVRGASPATGPLPAAIDAPRPTPTPPDPAPRTLMLSSGDRESITRAWSGCSRPPTPVLRKRSTCSAGWYAWREGGDRVCSDGWMGQRRGGVGRRVHLRQAATSALCCRPPGAPAHSGHPPEAARSPPPFPARAGPVSACSPSCCAA